jgi:hypothetical protein
MVEIDDRIHVAIRSYKRAGQVKTAAVVPFAWIYVPESQAADYRSHYGDVVVAIPDPTDGNLGRKNNAILDRSPKPWTLILDDDISRIGMWEGGTRHVIGPDQLAAVIIHHFEIAEAAGVRMWGINQSHDATCYRACCPFNLLAPILGPFVGHLSPELRYDETVGGKDDYDFWLLNIRAYHRTLRANKYFYLHGHGIGQGGFVASRTAAAEISGVNRLVAKWGDRVVKPGGSAGKMHSCGKNILNTRCILPIQGC